MAVTRDDVQDSTGQRTNIPGRGFARGFGIGSQYAVTSKTIGGIVGNPINGEVGFAPGALFENPITTVFGNFLWLNIGTQASAVWINVDAQIGVISLQSVFNTNTATASTTLTAANITGARFVYLNLSGTLTGAANATLPTVAATVAAIPNAYAGLSYNLRIINSSSGAFAWTVVTNTGWTLTGTMTIAQNTWRDFVVTFTSLTAATLQQVGTGTNS